MMAALAAWALAAPSAARAADVSTTTAVDLSTAPATASTTTVPTPLPPAPPPVPPGPVGPPPPPKPPSNDELSARAVASLRALASAYSDKRRTPFMRLVSDDFTGDLGTLEDALSSDFRSYRTIVLSVTPNQTVVKGSRVQVLFRFDMTTTDDLGGTSKFSGQAAYTFIDEDGKSKLYTMDHTPIFGTSLSSVENPISRSQGAPTTSGGTSAPGNGSSLCGNVITGSGFIGNNGESPAVAFDFSTQSNVNGASGDIAVFAGNLSTNGAAAITDVGPCDINTFSQLPVAINDSSDPLVVGDCYGVRTNMTKFAVVKITSVGGGGTNANFLYKYQTSGARCF